MEILSNKSLKTLLFLLAGNVFSFRGVQGQFTSDYSPFVFSSGPPSIMKMDFPEEYKSCLVLANTLKPEDAKFFCENLCSEKQNLLQGGNVYFNDPFSEYVNKVADKVLAAQSGLRSKLKIYVMRFATPSAITLPDGSIFINIGLLAALENESQLAFVIAHEAAHFEKNHSVKDFKRTADIHAGETNFYNPEGAGMIRLRYSRDAEFEADARGLEIMQSSPYDPDECGKALGILDDTLFLLSDMKLQLQNLLDSEVFPMDSVAMKKGFSRSASEKVTRVFSESAEDIESTHPSIEKRINALKEILRMKREITGEGPVKKEIKTTGDFVNIGTRAKFEIAGNLFTKSSFINSLYLSLYLNEKYPDNRFVKTLLARNLHWLAFYTEIEKVSEIAEQESFLSANDFGRLSDFVLAFNHNDLKKMVFGFMKKEFEGMKTEDDFFIYYAMTSEAYLGKESAKIVYSLYASKFPSGRYLTYAGRKAE